MINQSKESSVHADLLSTARKLLCPIDGNEPSNTDLRRAVSTAYYAVFHHLSRACSELLVKSEDKLLRVRPHNTNVISTA